jgi:DnaJ family protein C protein 2
MSATTPPVASSKVDLFEYTEEQLLEEKVLTHYEILGISTFCSQDDVKKAFRRSSLKYHPDKHGHDKDYAFLALKQAHDTLYDHEKRQAYDSTTLPFDDAIPPPRDKLLQDDLLLYKDNDFYELYRPVFERNLRFDANLRPDAVGNAKNGNHNGKKKKAGKAKAPPTLGDADTPIAQVHAFYEYWIHFESWRDFSAQATDELQVENELENAESRFEKRWIQKEIDKRAKQLKKTEMSRIQLLVERAMEADPRLRKFRQEQLAAKEQAKRERQEKAEQQKIQAQLEHERQQQQEVVDRQRRAEEKVTREQQKKHIRKARQSLRKMASASFESLESEQKSSIVWADTYDMNLDIEVLCTNLDLTGLQSLAQELENITCPKESLTMIHQEVLVAKQRETDGDFSNGEQSSPSHNGTFSTKETTTSPVVTPALKPNLWTKEELSALAKAVKKYPPGGSSRWEQIALFVNNLCKQDEPRSKEECIEKYNNVAKTHSKPTESTNGVAAASEPENSSQSNEDVWTAEQDQQLQDGLAANPASMDKNERWTAITECVPGKSKKQCVQRFKVIRDALKKKK